MGAVGKLKLDTKPSIIQRLFGQFWQGLVQIWKVVRILFWLMIMLPCSALLKVLIRDPGTQAKWVGRVSAVACGKIIDALGVKVTVKGLEHIDDRENYLVVSNHLSYIDPLVSYSLIPSVFVTSEEIRSTPLLGTLCESAGCCFIERRSIWNIHNEVKQMTDTLNRGRNVVFYPEGTTSDGSALLPFYTSFFQAAINAKRKILPITLNLDRVNGEPANASHKDLFCWYGDMSFAPHFRQFLTLDSVEITIMFHPPIQPDDSVNSRKKFAKIIRTKIKNEFLPLAPLRADAI